MKKLFKSQRSRIIAMLFLTGIIPIIVLHFIIVNTYENSLIDKRTIEIRQKCNDFSAVLSDTPTISEALSGDTIRLLNWYSAAFGGRMLLVDNNFTIIFDTYSVDRGKSCISEAVFSAFSGNEYSEYKSGSNVIEFVIPVYHTTGETKNITGAIVFSSTTEWINSSLKKVERGMLLVETLLLLLLVFFSIYVSYLLTRPIRKVSERLEKMENGDLSRDILGIDSYSEVNAILKPTAHIIESYQELEDSQSQFISNVSHELKTPMTSIRVLADSLIGQKGMPEDIYQEFLSDISVEVERETEIVEDLLVMSRIGKSKNSMNYETVLINDFVKDILKRLRPIAGQKNVELVYESFRQVTAEIDSKKLSQALTNLVENGIKYNRESGFVKVSLDADHEFFYVRVTDNGIGIPEEALNRIFDRFYRVDSARSRETGGSGLGLYITKTIILLHGGVIKAESQLDEGTRFTVRIPLKREQKGASK